MNTNHQTFCYPLYDIIIMVLINIPSISMHTTGFEAAQNTLFLEHTQFCEESLHKFLMMFFPTLFIIFNLQELGSNKIIYLIRYFISLASNQW